MSAKKWTDNTVYYYFDKSTASNARKVASTAAALEYLQYHTCINFVENATAPARIRIISGEGCYSAVGMTGRVQDLSIDDGCEVIGTVAHEFTHALGIWHTQMRSDRDTYVIIDLSDVPENKHHNFVKVAAAQNSITVPYDYGSFMHYGANFFVDKSNAISVLPKDSRYIHTIGGDLTSFYDIQLINDHYGCSTVCPAATSAKCKNRGVPNPRNCATCNCPLGYDGDLCDKRPLDPICGEILTASTAWQKKKFTFGTLTAFDQRDDYTICTHWITAPTGKKVQTKITQMANPQCVYSCSFNGIEIKTNADPRVTNPRFCCPEFMNQEMSSDLNPTPVVAYNRVGKTTFEIEYRFVDSDTTGSLNSTSSKAHESTTTTMTKAPSTNTSISTTTKKPSGNCKNDREEAYCAFQLHCDPNFCNPTDPGVFRNVKFRCGLFCGLCGKVAPGCADLLTNCADNKQKRACTILEPNLMEYACAKSCGFCENPN